MKGMAVTHSAGVYYLHLPAGNDLMIILRHLLMVTRDIDMSNVQVPMGLYRLIICISLFRYFIAEDDLKGAKPRH